MESRNACYIGRHSEYYGSVSQVRSDAIGQKEAGPGAGMPLHGSCLWPLDRAGSSPPKVNSSPMENLTSLNQLLAEGL